MSTSIVPWVAAGSAVVVVGGVALWLLRHRLGRLLRIAKALACDDRLPRPLRWALRAGLAIKALPIPDFGIDEVLLGVVVVLLATVYRPVVRDIVKETT